MRELLTMGGVGLAMAANVLTVFLARWGVARLLGVRGVGFVPSRGPGKPITKSRQMIALVAVLAAAYAFPVLFFSTALLIGGRVVTPAEAGTHVDVVPGKP